MSHPRGRLPMSLRNNEVSWRCRCRASLAQLYPWPRSTQRRCGGSATVLPLVSGILHRLGWCLLLPVPMHASRCRRRRVDERSDAWLHDVDVMTVAASGLRWSLRRGGALLWCRDIAGGGAAAQFVCAYRHLRKCLIRHSDFQKRLPLCLLMSF
jgi:hypothetical protein